MKRMITTVMLCASLLLTGCSDTKGNVAIDGNTAVLEHAGISIAFPDDWTVQGCDEIYADMYDSYYQNIYSSVDEMREELSAGGLSFHVYATSDGSDTDTVSIVTISSQDMTPAEDEESVPLEEYARTVHDSTIFEYLASGYMTGDDSSFSEEIYGGKTGFLSHFELTTENGFVNFVGFSEFMFQIDMELYSIQVTYFSEEEKAEALSIFDNITAA